MSERPDTCATEGCDGPLYCKGLCSTCYNRAAQRRRRRERERRADPNVPDPLDDPLMDAIERAYAKCEPRGRGCQIYPWSVPGKAPRAWHEGRQANLRWMVLTAANREPAEGARVRTTCGEAHCIEESHLVADKLKYPPKRRRRGTGTFNQGLA